MILRCLWQWQAILPLPLLLLKRTWFRWIITGSFDDLMMISWWCNGGHVIIWQSYWRSHEEEEATWMIYWFGYWPWSQWLVSLIIFIFCCLILVMIIFILILIKIIFIIIIMMVTRFLPQSSPTPSSRHSGQQCLEAKSMAWNNIRWGRSWWWLWRWLWRQLGWWLWRWLWWCRWWWFVMISLCSRWTTHTDKTASLVRWVSEATITMRIS